MTRKKQLFWTMDGIFKYAYVIRLYPYCNQFTINHKIKRFWLSNNPKDSFRFKNSKTNQPCYFSYFKCIFNCYIIKNLKFSPIYYVRQFIFHHQNDIWYLIFFKERHIRLSKMENYTKIVVIILLLFVIYQETEFTAPTKKVIFSLRAR